MEVILNSFLLVAATEMGDKTQLLAFVLASKFRKPWAVLAGIFVATVLNHALAASVGVWVSNYLSPEVLKWTLAAIFLGFAVWVLIPDKEDTNDKPPRYGAFLTTLIMFFLAEMGDKTQLSTIALSAQYKDFFLVTLGTTLGMMATDGAAVFLGEKLTQKISMKWVHIGASCLYVAFAIAIMIHGI